MPNRPTHVPTGSLRRSFLGFRRRVTLAWVHAIVVVLLASGCGRRGLVEPQVVRFDSTGSEAPHRAGGPFAIGPQHEEGTLGPGALYAIDVPESWNGDLVVYLHGYTPVNAPVALPPVGLRTFLLGQGYAVATTSFSANGYAVAEGTRQGHQLLGVFADRFGSPNHTFLVGASLGGIIGIKMVETYGSRIDGALLVSGVMGGTRAEVNYIGDIRVLWDQFFPGTIPGSVFDVPAGVAFDPAWVVGAISTAEGQAKFRLFLAFAAARGMRFEPTGNEPVLATLNALGFHWMGAMDLFDRSHDHVLYENRDVRYSAPGVPQAIVDAVNAGVARYAATRDAEAFLDRNYEPDGDLATRVLTLHGLRDPAVPAFHEDLYVAKVAARGKSELLASRKMNRFGHVVFDPADIPTAFLDLVRWVKEGTKPAV